MHIGSLSQDGFSIKEQPSCNLITVMSSMHDILTPQSIAAYTSWQANADPHSYEFVAAGPRINSFLIQSINENNSVIDSIVLNTTIDADQWLNEYVTLINSEETDDKESDLMSSAANLE